MKHYDKTKDLTSKALEQYMSQYIEVGDIVQNHGPCEILAKYNAHGLTYFWAMPLLGQMPKTLQVRDMDILEGM